MKWIRPVLLIALLAGHGRAELLPVETFAAAADVTRARLSPDGTHLAFLREMEGKTWLFFYDLQTKTLGRVNPGTVDPAGINLPKEIDYFQWVSNRRVAYLTTVYDGQNWTGVSAVDYDGKNQVPFTGYDGKVPNREEVKARAIIHSFFDEQENVLMLDQTADRVGGNNPDVIKISTRDPRIRKDIVKNPGDVVGWAVDPAGEVRVGITLNGTRYGAIYRENPKAPWRKLPDLDEKRGRISVLGFHVDGQHLFITANSDAGRRAIFLYDPATGKMEDQPVASHDRYDIIPTRGTPSISVEGVALAGPIMDGSAREVLGIRYYTEGPRVDWFDPDFKQLQLAVDKLLPTTTNLIANWTDDRKKFLIFAFSDRDPGQYFLFDASAEKPAFTRLFVRQPKIPVERMARCFPISYKARDGELINGYLTLPNGVGRTNLPVVIMPHGGPTVRDSLSFDLWAQFIASRGYAVLRMNYRGSPGYGEEFYQKGRHEIGGRIQDDIEDGRLWLIQNKVADPARIAILGSSYGGYSALFALGRNPGAYRGGVSISGVSDWAEMMDLRKRDSYKFAYQHWKEWAGDPRNDAPRLAEISPVNFADKIVEPVLLIHGEIDANVPPRQSRLMIDALTKVGRKPASVFMPREGHSLFYPESRTAAFTAVEAFLLKTLGPGASPAAK